MMLSRKFFSKSFLILLIFFCACSQRSESSFDIGLIKESENVHTVVVIGGGMSGLTSALYLSLAGYKPLVIEGPLQGGLLSYSHSVLNWPGEKEVSGADLTSKVRSQVASAGANFFQGEVVAVDFNSWPYSITVKSVDGKTRKLSALSCIVASGSTPKYLGIKGESQYWGKGVSNCAVCDGQFYKDKVVAVVGGGDSAIEEAQYLSNLVKKVYVVVRKKEFRAKSGRVKDLQSRHNIEVLHASEVKEVIGEDDKITKLLVENNLTKKQQHLEVDGLFLAIGHTPNTSVFTKSLELSSTGHIVLRSGQSTSIKGVFAAGDVVDHKYRQAVTASGDSAKAALDCIDFFGEIGLDISALERQMIVKSYKSKQQPMNIIEIENDEQFEKELTCGPAIVDFYAPWCPPCRAMHPIYEQLFSEFKGEVKFLRFNVDKSFKAASSLNVRSIPTLIFWGRDGKESDRVIGSCSLDLLRIKAQSLLI